MRLTMKTLAIRVLLASTVLLTSENAHAAGARLTVEGTEFVVRLDDGKVLRGGDVTGMQIILRTENRELAVRIDGVSEDDKAVGGQVFLYSTTVHDPVSGASQNFCAADPLGRSLGFPVPDRNGGFSFTCTSGAEGKCILAGYRPWDTKPGGPPLADLHRACVHLLRADYGGDDRPSTRNGTRIDFYDRYGIQVSEPADDMTFEAAWAPEGAVCVAHPRVADNISLDELSARYPRLKDRLGPQACSEETMRADPRALIFNRSVPASR